MKMPILQLENVTKKFGGVAALNNVTFQVEKGEVLGVIGPNGSGKTTLINVISGVYKPELGKLIYKGANITRVKPHLRCRMGIARTYQVVRIFSGLTVLENVVVGVLNGTKHGKISMGEALKEAERILSYLGLDKMKDLQAELLNIQYRKRLELARAIGMEPDLLMLDECLAGLTPSEVFEMLDVIKRVKEDRDMTIIMVEHLMHAVMNISDRIIVFNEGKIISEGKPEEIARDVKVAKVYFGDRELALKFIKR
jgi:branched-chain amino acid transport system ATP-binding protein